LRQLEALLFDVDGTLADTERDGHRVAFNRAFAEAGLGWNWSVETYGRLLAVTGGKERIRHFLETEDPPLPAIVDLDGFIAELHREKTRYYTDALSRGAIPLRTGVARLLQEARSAGLQLGIATTTTPANVTALLRYGLGPEALDWFGVIAAGDVVPAKKPAPDIYEYAMASLGLQPEVCAAFEDSVHGLHAARDAGIDTVIVAVNDYTREQDFSGASLVLDSLGDPGVPCHRLAGGDMVAEYLDLATVRRIHHGTAET
jgi:HAD superfamily hydrolase (TIGR01509 family)